LSVRRALLLLIAGIALLAGCGGGDDDDGGEATIQQLRIAYTQGARTLAADTWTLENGDDAAARSRLREGNAVLSDVALSEGFLAAYLPEAGQVAESPAGSASSPDPFTIADGLVEDGTLTADGTVQRDGREVQVYTGSPEFFLLAGGVGTFEPADAELRYLRDDADGRPVELLIPAATVRTEDAPAVRSPAQRYVVTGFREYPATEEAMEVFDLKAVYQDPGAATTTAP
jgi:hypothetical protein